MLFYFVAQEVLVKLPVPGFWQKLSIVKTRLKMVKHVTFVTVVSHLMQALL